MIVVSASPTSIVLLRLPQLFHTPGTTESLDISQNLRYHTSHKEPQGIAGTYNGVSFNGRTADSGSANWGSNPCTPATHKLAPIRVPPFFTVHPGTCPY